MAELIGVKLLVVDDNEDLLDILKFGFEYAGAQVFAATSITQALELLAKDSAMDVILSDLHMPKGSGVDLFQHVQKLNIQAPFILFMSDGAMSLQELQTMGIAKVVAKPFELDDLIQVVADIVQKKS